jgi:hypothetical protein
MPMDSPCCERSQENTTKNLVKNIVIILKKYDLPKELKFDLVKNINSEFVELFNKE